MRAAIFNILYKNMTLKCILDLTYWNKHVRRIFLAERRNPYLPRYVTERGRLRPKPSERFSLVAGEEAMSQYRVNYFHTR